VLSWAVLGGAILGGAGVLAALPAAGALVYVNTADVGFTPTSTVAQAKYRLSHTNFDQSLDNGAGTAKSGNFIKANLGNGSNGAPNIRGVAFNFSLQHTVGEGFTYRMTNTLTGTTSTLRWGSFGTTEGTTAATLGGLAPDRDFNSLLFETRATQTTVNPSFSVSGLTFTSASLTGVGSFFDRIVTPGYTEVGAASGFSYQRVVSDVNLADHNFTVAGQLIADRNVGNGSDEQLKFTIYAQQGNANLSAVSSGGNLAVPEPAAASMMLPAALLLMRRQRAERGFRR
jgi:hypothetical protein